MVFRTAGAVAALLIGLGGSGDRAFAQYYPAPQAYPPSQAYPPAQGSPYRPLPPIAEADEAAPTYGSPTIQSRPLPPAGGGAPQMAEPPPGVPYGRGGPAYPEEAAIPPPPPPGTVYREPPPGYVAVPQGYEPAAAGTRPYYGAPMPPAPTEQEATRPPLPIGPGQIDPTGSAQQGDPRTMAALPPEVRPETGPKKSLPPQFRRTLVDYYTKEPAGTIIIDTPNTYLYLVLGQGKALRYGIGVGREGFTWTGVEKVSRMAEWPDWHPPEEMIDRQPYLPRFMAGGDGNPLGARALYLGKTVYRIHGTNQPSTIGTFVSSGCIRLTNEDVMDLYTRVKVGTRVKVLPGHPPATATVTPPGPPAAAPPAGQAATTAPPYPPPSAMAR